MKQIEFFGGNSINNLEEVLKKENIKNAFLITGKESFKLCGAKKKIQEIFDKTNSNYTRFSDFNSNPDIVEIMRAQYLFKKGNYDAVLIAINGYRSTFLFDIYDMFMRNPNLEIYKINLIFSSRRLTPYSVHVLLIMYVIVSSETVTVLGGILRFSIIRGKM